MQLCQKSISSNNHLRFYIRSCYWRQWTLYVCLLLDLVIDDNKCFRFYFKSCYWRQWTLDVCCRILLLATALHTINVLCSPYIPSSHHWLHIKKGVWSHNICFIFFWQIQQRKIRGGSVTCLCDKKLYIFLTNSTPASAKENINHHCRKMSVTDFSVAFKPFIIPPQRKSAKYKSAI